jgi:hypothetical protein
MNIGVSFSNRTGIIPIFTWTWSFGGVLASAYFAFWLFPSIYESKTSTAATVWFQCNGSSSGAPSRVYWPNFPGFRKTYLSNLADREFLYVSRCDALPVSQRPVCDPSDNWVRVSPGDVGCKEVVGCETPVLRLSQGRRYEFLTGIRPLPGAAISVADLPNLSLSDPAGWGKGARWPIFFISLFLAIKLGRALGEFLFQPYSK